MQENSKAQWWWMWLLTLLAVLPALVTYGILWKTTTPIPYMDDYDAIVNFANVYHHLPTLSAKLLYINDATHVQYKLILLHSLVALDLHYQHRINLVLIQWLGNVSLLLITWCLWRMIPRVNLRKRLLYFLPVVLFVFVLRDNEAMGWAMGCLQQVAVVAFALLALYLFCNPRAGHFAGACSAFALAVWSSANGLLVLPVALLVLWQTQAWRRMFLLLVVSAILIVSYVHGFHPSVPLPSGHQASAIIIPAFYLALLGAVFSRLWLALPLGFLLLCVLVPVLRKALVRDRQLEPVSASILFLLLNAALISLGRYHFTMDAAIVSRYSIYSQVLLALLYLAYIRPVMEQVQRPLSWRTLPSLYVVSGAFAIVLFAHYERIGFRFLKQRQAASVAHMAAWENYGHSSSLVAIDEPEVQRSFAVWTQHSTLVLQESILEHIYVPPVLPPPVAPPAFFLNK